MSESTPGGSLKRYAAAGLQRPGTAVLASFLLLRKAMGRIGICLGDIDFPTRVAARGSIFTVTRSDHLEHVLTPFIDPELDAIDKQDKKGYAIDVGAHIGVHTLEMLKNPNILGVVAVEAAPANFAVLKENVKPGGGRCVPINKAAGSKAGSVRLYLSTLTTGAHSTRHKHEGGNFVDVDAITVDAIAEENRLSPVVLMKIDVEGAELDVLKGSANVLRKFHPRLIVEIDHRDPGLDRIWKFVSGFGYSVKKELNLITYLFE